jgi:hypothetical protein
MLLLQISAPLAPRSLLLLERILLLRKSTGRNPKTDSTTLRLNVWLSIERSARNPFTPLVYEQEIWAAWWRDPRFGIPLVAIFGNAQGYMRGFPEKCRKTCSTQQR